MSSPAIRVENLSKHYQIGARENGQTTLRDTLSGLLTNPFRRFKSLSGRIGSDESFCALKDVSFDVQPGEVVGIIGRNGAGKSTLLKVLSQITEPTHGRVEINGRVASLLEVGTGFHPELTGRENIFLNGSILGMSRAEIRRKFDEIVDFSGIEKFIDTPVKRYSSGMTVRLAFSVAAHLEPEILIIDEVLAVGDAAFQKKCLGKMGEVAGAGRTVAFVSHNMQTVTRLCTRGVLLDDGQVVESGSIDAVVRAYMHAGEFGPACRSWPSGSGPGDGSARLSGVRVRDQAGLTRHKVDIRHPIGIEMEYDVLAPECELLPNFHVFDADGLCLFVTGDLAEYDRPPKSIGRYRSTVWIPGNFLAEGTVSVHAALSTIQPSVIVHFLERDAVAFEVVDRLEGNSARGHYAGPYPGAIRPILEWETDCITAFRGTVP